VYNSTYFLLNQYAFFTYSSFYFLFISTTAYLIGLFPLHFLSLFLFSMSLSKSYSNTTVSKNSLWGQVPSSRHILIQIGKKVYQMIERSTFSNFFIYFDVCLKFFCTSLIQFKINKICSFTKYNLNLNNKLTKYFFSLKSIFSWAGRWQLFHSRL